MDFLVAFLNETTIGVFLLVLKFYPIWLPILLALLFWDIWNAYVRADFFFNQKHVLLEIRLPQNILKSAEAMDTLIGALYDTSGESDFISKFWEGKTRTWYSLELVSIGGDIKFFIWVRDAQKDFVESLIYSQYHEAEVHVASDYTQYVDYVPGKNDMWACDFKLTKADVYPIKTYQDFYLDEEQEEFFKVDPLTPVIEFLGSLGPDEQAWYQIVIRAHKDERKLPNVWPTLKWDPDHALFGLYLDTSKASFFKKVDWKYDAKKEIDKILATIKDKENKTVRQLTEGEKKKIEALERSILKPAFDTGIRAIYFANSKNAFKKTSQKSLENALRQFDGGLNGLKADKKTSFDFPWQDFAGLMMIRLKKKLLKAYKKRGFFYNPIKWKTYVLNSEELATLYHFPGAVATTPKLNRIPSKKAQAPANLPI